MATTKYTNDNGKHKIVQNTSTSTWAQYDSRYPANTNQYIYSTLASNSDNIDNYQVIHNSNANYRNKVDGCTITMYVGSQFGLDNPWQNNIEEKRVCENWGLQYDSNRKVKKPLSSNYTTLIKSKVDFEYNHGWTSSVLGWPADGLLWDTDHMYLYITLYDNWMAKKLYPNPDLSWNGTTATINMFYDKLDGSLGQIHRTLSSSEGLTLSDVKIVAEDGDTGVYEGYSNNYNFLIKQHQKVSLHRGTEGIVYWTSCSTATNGYDVYKDGNYVYHTNGTQYTIPDADKYYPHQYSVRVCDNTVIRTGDSYVVAYDNNPDKYGAYSSLTEFNLYYHSELSTSAYYFILETPQDVRLKEKVSYNQFLVGWDKVNGASGYNVYVDGSYYTSTGVNECLIRGLNSGTHKVKVSANSGYDNINNSGFSSELTLPVIKFEAPVIRLDGERIVWDTYDTVNNGGASFILFDTYSGITYQLNTVTTLYYILDTPTVRSEPGTHQFQIQAVAVNSNGEIIPEWSSNRSNVVEVYVQTLDRPNIRFTEEGCSLVVWDAITNASYYDLYVDDTITSEEIDPSALDNTTKRNSYPIYDPHYDNLEELFGNTPGMYAIKVKAMSNLLEWEDSPKSNIIFYKVAKINAPTNLAISDTGVLTYNAATANWFNSTSNKFEYDIYVNDMFVGSTQNLEYQLALLPGESYVIQVQAREITQRTTNANPKFLISELSDAISIGKLSTPTNLHTTSDGYLRWDAVDNAKTYDIMSYGVELSKTANNYYKVPNSKPAIFSFNVKCLGWGSLIDSDASSTLMVYVIKLGTPAAYIDGMLVRWNYIPNAESYDVYVNNIKVASTSNNYYDLTDVVQNKGGVNKIYIVATHSSELIIDSDKSNTVSLSVATSFKYYARIKENGTWSEPIDIEMPMTITDKYDDSLNTATITLVQNSVSKPYQSYTDVQICFNADDGEYPFKVRYYIIVSDTVQQRPRGNKKAYSHTLNLIERTRFLQTEMLPNMTITQPQAFVYNEWANKGNVISAELGGNFILTGEIQTEVSGSTVQALTGAGMGILATNGIGAAGIGIYAAVAASAGPVGWILGAIGVVVAAGAITLAPIAYESMHMFMFEDNNVVCDPPASVEYNWEFYLPHMSTQKITTWRQRYLVSITGIEYGSCKKKSVKDTYLTQRWYIRKHNANRTDQYNKYSDTPEVEIASYNALTSTSYPSFKFSDSTYYMNNKDVNEWDLILEIDDADGALYTFTTNPTMIGIDFRDGEWSYDWHQYNAPLMSTTDLPPSRQIAPNKHFRIVFPKIKTVYTQTTQSVESTIYVSDALQKIVNNVNVLKLGESAKYRIDPEIIARTSTLPIYQLKFEGKSLYEALDTIGKEFLGVPYLVDDTNVISFRIRDEHSVYTLIDDNNEPKTEASSIDNNSTGFVCDAVNMISKENYEVYPGNDLWMSPRSTDESTAYVTTTNCGIVVDKPIAYLKKVEITGFNDFGSVGDITAYCYEKTIYDALNADNNGKGKALYWQIGDNKIYGLGILEKYFNYGEGKDIINWMGKALGLSPTHYVIQNILYDKYGVSEDDFPSSKVKDLKFRITYIPYNDSRVVVEQFDTSDYQNYSYKTYNQTDGTIVDTSFGNVANKAIERLGNNTLTRMYKQDPEVNTLNAGDSVLIDGTMYYVDTITWEYKNKYVNITCDFTKNFNKINERMGVNSEYRQYEIYNKDITDRCINVNHYCYLSTTEDFENNDATATANWPLIIKDCLDNNPHESLQNFYVNVYAKGINNPTSILTYTDYEGNKHSVDYGFAIHATRLTPRNSIMFTGKMADNYAAGYYTNIDKTYEGKYENKAIRYCDDLGQVYAIDLALGNPTQSQLYGTDSSTSKYAVYKYPMCERISSPNNGNINDCVLTNTYVVDKDNREALSFTYQMHFKTEESEFYLHQGLSKYMFVSKNEDISILSNPIIIGYKGAIKNKEFLSYSSNDVLSASIITGTTSNGTTYIKSVNVNPKTYYDGFAIIYPSSPAGSGLMLLHYSKQMEANKTYTLPNIYFNLKDKLIEK